MGSLSPRMHFRRRSVLLLVRMYCIEHIVPTYLTLDALNVLGKAMLNTD